MQKSRSLRFTANFISYLVNPSDSFNWNVQLHFLSSYVPWINLRNMDGCSLMYLGRVHHRNRSVINRCQWQLGSVASAVSQHVSQKFDNAVSGELQTATWTMASLEPRHPRSYPCINTHTHTHTHILVLSSVAHSIQLSCQSSGPAVIVFDQLN